MNLARRFMSASSIVSRWRRNYLLRNKYAIYTSQLDTYKGGKFDPTYEEESKGRAYSTRISVLMKGCTNLCGNDKIYWESKSHEWLAQQPMIRYDIIKHMRDNNM